LEVVSADKRGLLSKMSAAITDTGANITKALIRTTEDQKAVATFEIEVKGIRALKNIISSLEKIKTVISVQRITGEL
jgi:guanosine-3',5'-bis(diphosphate) 3'-pyrophosphohydrolase